MLRDYQFELDARIDQAYTIPGVRNVMATMATGGGKSVVIGHRLRKFNGPAAVMAHRSELVSQLALTLNREEIPHGVIAPKEIISQIVRLEIDTHGKSYYRQSAPIRVASANTLAIRDPSKDRWYAQCGLAVVDEGHHVTKGGMWEQALNNVPNALGLFKTAHACRGDGLGLGRHHDGLVDALVVGPCGRDLMDRGYLCDYGIICPPTDIDISDIPIGASGELVQKALRERIHASKMLTGDIVKQYIRRAGGKLGLTFVVDIEEAEKTVAAYRAAGVPSEIITADTPIPARATIMRRFRARQLLQLVSVDVLSEGVDVPAVEVISLGRHTESWQLYCQQIGRGLRPMIDDAAVWAAWDQYTDAGRLAHIAASRKPRALIIDHVENVMRHYLKRGLPDVAQVYSLDRRTRGAKVASDAIPLRHCLNEDCFKPYSAILLKCPYCGTAKPDPTRRGAPDQVEGDLFELDLAVLRAMRGEIERIDGPGSYPSGCSPIVAASILKKHHQRQMAQGPLRDSIALWAGWRQQSMGLHDREIHRLFFHRFGIDVGTAQTLGAREAADLEQKIRAELDRYNVVRDDHANA